MLFHLVPPEAEDTSPGARVPSRQLARFLDKGLLRVAVVAGPDGKPLADSGLLEMLEEDGRALPPDQLRAAFPDLATFVDAGGYQSPRYWSDGGAWLASSRAAYPTYWRPGAAG